MPTTEEILKQLSKLHDSKDETKSQRMQILVTPTMYKSLKMLSDRMRDEGKKVSMNEIVNLALLEYLKGKE